MREDPEQLVLKVHLDLKELKENVGAMEHLEEKDLVDPKEQLDLQETADQRG